VGHADEGWRSRARCTAATAPTRRASSQAYDGRPGRHDAPATVMAMQKMARPEAEKAEAQPISPRCRVDGGPEVALVANRPSASGRARAPLADRSIHRVSATPDLRIPSACSKVPSGCRRVQRTGKNLNVPSSHPFGRRSGRSVARDQRPSFAPGRFRRVQH
jgi:hypothetical protein